MDLQEELCDIELLEQQQNMVTCYHCGTKWEDEFARSLCPCIDNDYVM